MRGVQDEQLEGEWQGYTKNATQEKSYNLANDANALSKAETRALTVEALTLSWY